MTNRKITFSLRKGEGKCWNLCATGTERLAEDRPAWVSTLKKTSKILVSMRFFSLGSNPRGYALIFYFIRVTKR